MNELLIELVASPWREIGLDGQVASAPAWHDLSDEERVVAYDRAVVDRAIEAALDPDGLSLSSRRVLALLRAGQ